jgi:integrase/recombinase XerD
MTTLRQRMREDMQLRGLAPRTQQSYVQAVQQLTTHYGKPPDQITEEELRQYFLYLRNEKRAARTTCTVALCTFKFLFEHTLQQPWPHSRLHPPTADADLAGRPECGGGATRPPLHPSAPLPRLPEHHLCLWLALTRQCPAAGPRSTVPACRSMYGVAKVAKNSIPLPQCTLTMLRAYWVTHRHPVWLFRACWPVVSGLPQTATSPMDLRGVHRAFQVVRSASPPSLTM